MPRRPTRSPPTPSRLSYPGDAIGYHHLVGGAAAGLEVGRQGDRILAQAAFEHYTLKRIVGRDRHRLVVTDELTNTTAADAQRQPLRESAVSARNLLRVRTSGWVRSLSAAVAAARAGVLSSRRLEPPPAAGTFSFAETAVPPADPPPNARGMP